MDEHDVIAEAALAWKMRQQDPPATVREIAEHLGVSVGTAHARIRLAADAQVVTGDVADRSAARIREAATLDELDARLAAFMDTVDDPNATARTRLLVSAARRRLLGLDAPTRVAFTDDRTPATPDPAIADAIRAETEHNAAEREAVNRSQRRADRPDGVRDPASRHADTPDAKT